MMHQAFRICRNLFFVLLAGLSGAACVEFECRASDPLCSPLAALLLYGQQRFRPCRGGPTTTATFYGYAGAAGGDEGRSVCLTANGGIVLAGSVAADIPTLGGKSALNPYAGAGQNGLIVRLDGSGAVDWYSFVGAAGGNVFLNSISETADGGVILFGYSSVNIAALGGLTPRNAYTGANDDLAVKLNSSGVVQWYTFLGAGGDDQGKSVIGLGDGSVLAASTSGANVPSLQGKSPVNAHSGGSDGRLCKLDSNGDVQWYTFFGDLAAVNFVFGLSSESDGGAVLASSVSANVPAIEGHAPLNAYVGGYDGMLARFDASGHLQWYTFAGSAGFDQYLSVDVDSQGKIAISGTVLANLASLEGHSPLIPFAGAGDGIVARYNPEGTLDWYSMIGGGGADQLNAVAFDATDNVYAAGLVGGGIVSLGGQAPRNAFSAANDLLAVKFSPTGAVQWFTMLGAAGDDRATSIVPTPSGGAAFNGYSDASAPTLQGKTAVLPYAGGVDLFFGRIDANGDL
ncbi:MAG: hypothetical protein K1X75_11115 [Leptospirales bacterium]|nr:hypothetical protein [Leptospirales bacterium]